MTMKDKRILNSQSQTGSLSERKGTSSKLWKARLGSSRFGLALTKYPRIDRRINVSPADNQANVFARELLRILQYGSERKCACRFALQVCQFEIKPDGGN